MRDHADLMCARLRAQRDACERLRKDLEAGAIPSRTAPGGQGGSIIAPMEDPTLGRISDGALALRNRADSICARLEAQREVCNRLLDELAVMCSLADSPACEANDSPVESISMPAPVPNVSLDAAEAVISFLPVAADPIVPEPLIPILPDAAPPLPEPPIVPDPVPAVTPDAVEAFTSQLPVEAAPLPPVAIVEPIVETIRTFTADPIEPEFRVPVLTDAAPLLLEPVMSETIAAEVVAAEPIYEQTLVIEPVSEGPVAEEPAAIDGIQVPPAVSINARRAPASSRLLSIATLVFVCLVMVTFAARHFGVTIAISRPQADARGIVSENSAVDSRSSEAIALVQQWHMAGDDQSVSERLGTGPDSSGKAPAWSAEKVDEEVYLVLVRERSGTHVCAFETNLKTQAVLPTPEAVDRLTLMRVRDEATTRLQRQTSR